MTPLELIDLSHTLSPDTPVYPGDPPYTCCPVQTIAADGSSVHRLTLGSHTGTHIDAPSHFFPGAPSVDQLPLSRLVGTAVVCDVTGKAPRATIGWADLAPYEETIRAHAQAARAHDDAHTHDDDAPAHGVFVLLHTGWSQHWKTPAYYAHPFLALDAAQRLLSLGATLIGVDTLSPDETRVDVDVDGPAPEFAVHAAVLGAGALIAENLTNLEAIQGAADGRDGRDGREWLVSLVPLKLGGLDGSPVRAFACARA